MRNEKYFELISKIHDQSTENQILNLILGAYNEIAELEKKIKGLEDRIFAAALKSGIVGNEDQNVTTENLTVPADSEVIGGN